MNCHSHRLNLALQDALNKIPEARNCLGTLNSLYTFIEGSPKRHAIFNNMQLENQTSSIKRVDGTRWSSRSRAVSSLIKTYGFVLDTLAFIGSTDKSPAGPTLILF